MDYQSKSELVAREIKRLINSAELAPGCVLKQRDLAERFGVSATPVREALRQLEAEGFIVTELHRGATVVRSESARLEENALIRAALEGLAARLAVNSVTDADVEELVELNEQIRTEDEPGRLGELNRLFHFRVYEIMGSAVMMTQLRLLWRTLDGGPKVDRPKAISVAQHDQLIEALRERDGDRAEQVVRTHILEAFGRLEA